MSETKQDGGPAFPRPAGEHTASQSGMSLRAYAALKLAAAIRGRVDGSYVASHELAILACGDADALIAELKKYR